MRTTATLALAALFATTGAVHAQVNVLKGARAQESAQSDGPSRR